VSSKAKYKMTVSFYVEGMPFDGETIKHRSLGGSETAALCMAREIAKRGHNVFMFCNTPRQGLFDGVIYRPLQEYRTFILHSAVDVNISQRQISPFTFPNKAKINILWAHDLYLKRNRQAIASVLWNIDEIWALSDFHKNQIMKIQDIDDKAIWVTRNAIDEFKLDKKIERAPKRLVFAARPERGLDTLLKVMEHVWEKDPDIELGICEYDNKVPHMMQYYAVLKSRIQEYQRQGRRVQHIGSLTKEQLYKFYQTTTMYVYPSNFEETSCITAMECMACGVPLIGNYTGALPETLDKKAGVLLRDENGGPLDFDDATTQKEFAKVVLDLLRDKDTLSKMGEAGKIAIKRNKMTWNHVAAEWEKHVYAMFRERSNGYNLKIKEAFDNVLPGYKEYDAPKMSIVIPTIRDNKAVELVVKQLDKVSSMEHEYIIVANGVKLKKTNALKNCKIISFDENEGVTKAWNAGIKAATTDHICIANDDAFPFKGWDKQLTYAMDKYGLYGISPAEHSQSHPEPVIFNQMEGCLHIIKKEVFDKLGLYDEDYYLVYSDTDMKEKMLAADMKFGIARDVLIWHQRSVSRRLKGADFDNEWELKDRIVFEKKYANKPKTLIRHPFPGTEEEIAKFQKRKHEFYKILGRTPIYGLQMLENPEDLIQIVEAATPRDEYINFQVLFGEHKEFHKIRDLDMTDIFDLFRSKEDMSVSTVPSGKKINNEYTGAYVVKYKNCKTNKLATINLERKQLMQAPRQTVSCCMIVRNGEDHLHGVLKKIKDHVDELIIVDTGSTDSTKDIAALYTDKIYDGPNPLEVGFDTTRNFSIEKASSDWILWIDADEELHNGQELYKYLRHSILNGYAIAQHNISVIPRNFNNNKPDMPIRLFRNNRGVKFYGKVHEHPEDAIGESIRPAYIAMDIHIAHLGFMTEEIRRNKFKRNWPHQEAGKEDGRLLTTFLRHRDLAHKARYAFEEAGNVTNEDVKGYAEEDVKLYRGTFLEDKGDMGMGGMMWFSESLRFLGKDKIKSEVIEGMLQDLRESCPNYCFETSEEAAKFFRAQIDRRLEPYVGKYV
jgi:glycosyltransferase involved in cell wall biosynthesis